MKKIIYSFLFIATLLAQARADEVWVSPVGTDNTGTGTAANPYIRSSQSSFDTLFSSSGFNISSSSIPANSLIHLMPGTFLTQGGVALKSGWKFRGAGMGVTTIQIVPQSSAPGYSETHVIGGPPWYYSGLEDNIEISDMTIDCNLQNQTVPLAIGAVLLQGSNTKISRVRTINWGTTRLNCEAFIFSISPGWWGPASTNCLIEDCVVEQPAAVTHVNGSDGFCIGGSPTNNLDIGGSSWLCGGEIRNCRIFNVQTGSGTSQPQYFNGIGIGNGVDGIKVHDNLFMNVGGQAIASSCGSLVNCSIADNMLLNVGSGIVFQGGDWCPDNTNSIKENIHVTGNVITLQSGGYGIALSGIFGQQMTNVDVNDNVVQADGGAGAVNGLVIAYTANLAAANNILDGNGGTALLIGTATEVSELANNRMLDGQKITSSAWQPTYTGDGGGLTNVTALFLGTPAARVKVSSDSTSLGFDGGSSANNSLAYGTNSSTVQPSWATVNSFAFGGGQSGHDSLAFDGGLADHESLAFGFNHDNGGMYGQYSRAYYGSLAFGLDPYAEAYTNSMVVGNGVAYINSVAVAGAHSYVNSFGMGGWNTLSTNGAFAFGNYSSASDDSLSFYGTAQWASIALGPWAHATNSSFAAAPINSFGSQAWATNFQWVCAGYINGYTFNDGDFKISKNLNVGGVISGNGSGITNISIPAKPLLIANLSSSITIASNLEHRVWFDHILSSNSISYSTNSGITIGVSGVYEAKATVTWQGTTASPACVLYLVKNGTDYFRAQQNLTQNSSLTLDTDIPATAGDTIDFRVWQNNTAGNLTVVGNTSPFYQTFLSFRQVQ